MAKNDLKSIELPLITPPIYYSSRHACPLSIALTNEHAWSWFYSSFTQMKCNKNGEGLIIYHDYVPFVRTLKFFGLKTAMFHNVVNKVISLLKMVTIP